MTEDNVIGYKGSVLDRLTIWRNLTLLNRHKKEYANNPLVVSSDNELYSIYKKMYIAND